MSFLVVWNLLARRPLHPVLRNQLFAVPFALLQIELAKLGDVFRAQLQPVAAERIAFRAAGPIGIFNPKWLKQTRLQKLEQRLPRCLRNNRGQGVAAQRVVKGNGFPARAGLAQPENLSPKAHRELDERQFTLSPAEIDALNGLAPNPEEQLLIAKVVHLVQS